MPAAFCETFKTKKMKTNIQVKSILLQAMVIATALAGVSACTTNNAQDSKEVAEDKNEAKFASNKLEKDAEFLVYAAESNLQEINLGKLAQEKGTISHVKELGKTLQTHHEKAMVDLIALAKIKMISLPMVITEDGRAAFDKLNKESGSDFDMAYADLMVEKHEDAIDRFEKASADSDDADIRAMATSSLPTLRGHLEQSLSCQEACQKAKSL